MANTKITADNIAANAITASSITDGTITAAKLAANSVDSDQYVDGSIDTIHIADGAITSAKLDTNIAIAGTLGVTGAITGTLATAAQPNITSVGSLTALDVTGTATMDGLTVDGLITLAGSTSGNRTVKDSFLNGALSNQGFLRSSGGNYWGYSTYQDGSANWKSAVSVASERAVYAMDEDTAYWSFAPSQTVAIGSDLTTQPSEKIRFDLQNGRVGIGTQAPAQPLHVLSSTVLTAGVARFQYSGGNDYEVIRVESLGNNDAHIGFFADGDTNYYGGFGIDYSDAGKFKLQTDNLFVGGSTLMTWTRDGNVGIGTSSPTGSKLQVQGDGIGIKLDGTANTTRSIFFRNTTSSNPAQIYSDGSLRLCTEDAGTDIRFHTVSNGTNNERLRINSDGALVLQEGNPIYADTGRVVNFGVPASYGNALNFATLGGLEAATGFYLVTVVRNGASVGSNWIGLIGVSTSGASYIYNVIYANGISAQMSGSWLQLQSASTIYVHITAVPIGITGNDT